MIKNDFHSSHFQKGMRKGRRKFAKYTVQKKSSKKCNFQNPSLNILLISHPLEKHLLASTTIYERKRLTNYNTIVLPSFLWL